MNFNLRLEHSYQGWTNLWMNFCPEEHQRAFNEFWNLKSIEKYVILWIFLLNFSKLSQLLVLTSGNFQEQHCLASVMVTLTKSFRCLSFLGKQLLSFEMVTSSFKRELWHEKFPIQSNYNSSSCQHSHVSPKLSVFQWVALSLTAGEMEEVFSGKSYVKL